MDIELIMIVAVFLVVVVIIVLDCMTVYAKKKVAAPDDLVECDVETVEKVAETVKKPWIKDRHNYADISIHLKDGSVLEYKDSLYFASHGDICVYNNDSKLTIVDVRKENIAYILYNNARLERTYSDGSTDVVKMGDKFMR